MAKKSVLNELNDDINNTIEEVVIDDSELNKPLSEDNFEIEQLETQCEINLVDLVIVGSHLIVQAKIKEIINEKFQEIVKKEKKIA